MTINKLTPNQNILWQSSRMMLPEHVEAIIQQQKQQLKREKVQLDEQHMNELAALISEAIYSQHKVTVKLFQFDEVIKETGVIGAVNQHKRQIKLYQNNDSMKWIDLDDITDIVMD